MDKKTELERSAHLFKEILHNQGMYFALMFLLDSGYGKEEIEVIAKILK